MKRRLILSITVLVAVGGTIWLYGQQQTGPTITWSQANVLEFLVPKETRKLKITFRSRQDLSNVVVQVTPSLAQVVSVSPSSLARVRTGRDTDITLTLTASSQSEVKFTGTLHLREALNPSATFAAPLPITIVIHNKPVPPDPGEAGKQTLQGIDSNGNGVRDDVERWIILNSIDAPSKLRALEQVAIATQRMIRSSSSADSQAAAEAEIAGSQCLGFIFGASAAYDLTVGVSTQVLNTPARRAAYDASAQRVDTAALPAPPSLADRRHSCSFDPTPLDR